MKISMREAKVDVHRYFSDNNRLGKPFVVVLALHPFNNPSDVRFAEDSQGAWREFEQERLRMNTGWAALYDFNKRKILREEYI